jgi:sulfide:quinone oxidoreductase
VFCTALTTLFTVPEYAAALQKVIDRRGIEVCYQHNLQEIHPDTQEAIFTVTTPAGITEVSLHHDMLHVAPPMSAPNFIKQSPLAVPNNPGGWVDVNKDTLQHNRYANVFGIGDTSSLPTSKTAAAIRKQAPVLVENLLSLMKSNSLSGKYDGYTCCPLTTGYNTTIMAEFDYSNHPNSSFPLDPTQERYSMWIAKTKVMPWLYWNRMLKGKPFEANVLKPLKQLIHPN